MARKKRRGRFARVLERTALGAVMGTIAFFLERRLLRSVRGRDRTASENDRGRDLSVSSQDVDDETGG